MTSKQWMSRQIDRLREESSAVLLQLRAMRDDPSGAVMSEYVVLVGVVGLVVMTALVGIGPQLLSSYERSRGILMCPLP